MSLIAIAWRSLTQRAFASALTGLSMALGVSLVVAVLVIHHVTSESFRRSSGLGYDIIVGAKGGRLELVLNTVYHLGAPVENIPYSLLRELKTGQYSRYVASAVPYCLGDNYRGYRVVATTPDLFQSTEFLPGQRYAFAEGRNFEADHDFEAVVGATAGRDLGLKVGDTFRPTHGIADDGLGHQHDAFTIVGILEPTGTANDRALFINMEGFYLLENHAKPDAHAAPDAAPHKDDHGKAHEHEHEKTAEGHDHGKADGHDHDHEKGHDHVKADAHDHDHDHDHGKAERARLPESQRELTAILVKASSPAASIRLPNLINEGNQAQAVLPIREIRLLFDTVVGPVQVLLLVLTGLTVVVAAVGVLVSISSSMNDRRREIAVIRALGARRETVRAVVLLESVLLSLIGGASGWLLGRLLVLAISPAITARTGVSVGLAGVIPSELALVPLLIVLAILAGYLPAMTAYRTDVARALAQTQ